MDLARCPKCNAEIFDWNLACPSCGYELHLGAPVPKPSKTSLRAIINQEYKKAQMIGFTGIGLIFLGPFFFVEIDKSHILLFGLSYICAVWVLLGIAIYKKINISCPKCHQYLNPFFGYGPYYNSNFLKMADTIINCPFCQVNFDMEMKDLAAYVKGTSVIFDGPPPIPPGGFKRKVRGEVKYKPMAPPDKD